MQNNRIHNTIQHYEAPCAATFSTNMFGYFRHLSVYAYVCVWVCVSEKSSIWLLENELLRPMGQITIYKSHVYINFGFHPKQTFSLSYIRIHSPNLAHILRQLIQIIKHRIDLSFSPKLFVVLRREIYLLICTQCLFDVAQVEKRKRNKKWRKLVNSFAFKCASVQNWIEEERQRAAFGRILNRQWVMNKAKENISFNSHIR